MNPRPFITTGIAGLDQALGDKLQPGNLIGVIGGSGAGKTIFATQLALHALKMSPPCFTLLFETETPDSEIWHRILSAEFSINYGEVLNHSESVLRIPNSPLLPHPDQFGKEGVLEAQTLLETSSMFLQFEKTDSTSLYLPDYVAPTIAKFEKELPGTGGIVILDYVELPSEISSEDEGAAMMRDLVSILREAADRGNLLVFAFAQAQPVSAGRRFLEPKDTAYVHDLFKTADAFIGIGQEFGNEEMIDPYSEASLLYRKKQSLNVTIPEKWDPIRVPVTHRFEYQRFEDREADEQKVGDYLPFTRSRFRELCSIGLPTCINLYAFLAIHARYRQKPIGASWHSRVGISKKTGLTEKQLRRATERLESKGLIQTKRRGSSTLQYTIQDWHEHHTADLAGNAKDGYVRIYRSMAERDWLFGNPDSLRLWLFILSNAKVHTDARHLVLLRGRLKFDPDEIEHEIGMKEDHTREALQELQEHDSIQLIQVDFLGEVICVTNWNRYQVDV